MTARRRRYRDDGVPRVKAPPNWPFPPGEMGNSSSRGEKGKAKIWKRTRNANERKKMMDVDKEDLDETQRRERKKAKKTSKSMAKREDMKKESSIVDGMLATDGVGLSQASAYEKGLVMNSKGLSFCSQRAVKQYRNGTETDSDDD